MSLAFTSCCSLIRRLNEESTAAVTRRGDRGLAAPSPRYAGRCRAGRAATRAVSPSARPSRSATNASSLSPPGSCSRSSASTVSSSRCSGPLDDELVVRRELRDREERPLDLAREDVDAADDQHVVGPSDDARHPGERAAAGAGLARERGEVAGAVAQQRQRLLRQRREDELADLAVRHRLARLRVDDLDEEVILVHVRAAPRPRRTPRTRRAPSPPTGRRCRRAVSSSAASIASRSPSVHGSAPKTPARRLRRAGSDDVVGDRERVARRAAEDLGAEILQQLRLARRVAARCRDDRAAEPLGAVVEAEAAGEEAVAVRDVDDRARPGSRRRERAGAAVRPGREVGPRVRDDRRLPARARRGVDPHALRERHLQEPERVCVPQLRLDAEGLLRQRLELDAEPLPQALALELLELRARAASRARAGRSASTPTILSPCKRQLDRPRRSGVRTTFIANREGRSDLLEGMDACFAELLNLGSWRM